MQKKGFDEREYSFQEVERVERLFWEDFERLVTEELKKAALEKLRKAQYDQEGVVSNGSASRRKYQSTMREISDGKSKTMERVLKLRAAMAAKEEEKKARLTMRDMQKSLEMEQRLAAQRRVQTGDSFLQKMERTRVTGKIREVILDKLASKVSAEKAKSDERERQAEIRLTALREMQSVRLAALKLASDTRANQVRSAKEAAEKQVNITLSMLPSN